MPRFTKKARAKWRSEARSDPEAVEVLKNLGACIRELRTEKQLSQEKAAERAGLSPQHLVDIEHGRTNPTVTSLVGIARALGVKVRDLLNDM
ncbi:MAG: helix-turn-helix transcriptional regulator [Polyangia bacterium]